MKDPIAIFVSRYKKKQLPSFLIVKTNSSEEHPKSKLEDWACTVLEKIGLTKDHPDVLWVKKNKKNKSFQVDSPEINELYSFQKYRPLRAPHRLVFVEDAHLLGERLENKLLKTLEEPQEETSIIFLSPTTKRFLPTIESRAVILTLFTQKSSIPTDKIKEQLDIYLSKEINEHALIDMVQKKHEYQNSLLLHIICHKRDHPTNFENTDSFLKEIQWFIKAQLWQNSPAERFVQLLQILKLDQS